MPRYEYECTECDWSGTIWHSMSDDTTRDCECGANLERTISMPGTAPDRFQMEAVLTNGQRVAGHFGRTDRKNRNKWG